MSLALLNAITNRLPYTLQEQIDGYASSIQESAEEILKEARIAPTIERKERLVFVAGVRRIWTIVDAQYWIVDNSLSIASSLNVSGIRIGSVQYAKGSVAYNELRDLRAELERTLRALGLFDLIRMDTLRDIAEELG